MGTGSNSWTCPLKWVQWVITPVVAHVLISRRMRDNIMWGEGGRVSVNAVDATPVLGGALEEPELTHTWGWVGVGRAVPWGGACEGE